MPSIFLTEQNVRDLIDMPATIQLVEAAFRQLAVGRAVNSPRTRAKGAAASLQCMCGAAEYLGCVGWKAYTTTPNATRFLVGLYSADTGELQLLAEADHLGQLRTGAATGVACRYMARADASTIGIFGAGLQARTQLKAVCCVRDICRIEVYCRDEQRRRQFADEISRVCATEAVPADDPANMVKGNDIIICATTSKAPVFDGRNIVAGTHVNAIGGSSLSTTEIDDATVERADRIACDNIEQCRSEAGELAGPIERGVTDWSRVAELGDLVSEKAPGRRSVDEITLFKSVGLAILDVAMGAELLRRATEQGVGRPLPF